MYNQEKHQNGPDRTGKIGIYLFKEDDGRDRQERIKWSVEHYFGEEKDALPLHKVGKRTASDRQQAEQLFRVEKTLLGKPYFPNMPKLHLSISHSGAYWVCALAPEEIGVDIQEHVMHRNETRQEATVRFAKMARRFFHPVEAGFVEVESFYRFFGVWAARESYVKYTGQGIDASFSEHCVIPKQQEQWPELTPLLTEQLETLPADGLIQRQESVLLGQGNPVSWHAKEVWFWETVLEDDYTLCVCAGDEMPCRIIRCF